MSLTGLFRLFCVFFPMLILGHRAEGS